MMTLILLTLPFSAAQHTSASPVTLILVLLRFVKVTLGGVHLRLILLGSLSETTLQDAPVLGQARHGRYGNFW